MSAPVKEAPVPDLDSEELRRRSRRTLLLSLIWPGALLVLAAVLARIELPDEVRGALDGGLHPLPFALGIVLSTASIPAMGMRWRALLADARGRGLSPAVMTAVVAVAQLMGSALPGPVGELAAAGLLKKRGGVPVEEALASAVHARALGLLSGALLALVVQIVLPPPVPEAWRGPLLIGAAVATVGALALFGLVLFSDRLERIPEPSWLAALDARPGKASALLARGMRAGRSFIEACAGVGSGSLMPHGIAMGWALTALVFSAGATMLTLDGLGADYDVAGVLFTQGAISVIAVVLVLLPGLAAGWDAAYVALLVTTAGVPLVPAVAVTGILRIHHTIIMAFGAPALAWLVRRDSPPPEL
ncbi:MAG: flippase-like domain-containing protein [Deltaproteobacteria bacterium]|nr:flippase-like domain-containing protein [Deltaproteobacteria bacterium]